MLHAASCQPRPQRTRLWAARALYDGWCTGPAFWKYNGNCQITYILSALHSSRDKAPQSLYLYTTYKQATIMGEAGHLARAVSCAGTRLSTNRLLRPTTSVLPQHTCTPSHYAPKAFQ
jgi:hypothetical protein